MLHAFRSARPPPQSLLPYSLHKNSLNSTIRFAQAQSGPTDAAADDMDSKKENHPQSKTMDTMSSLGEGYATRSDDEGFGGVYGGNQYLSKDADKAVDGDDADHTQGSEVKEKEKARNQEKIPRQAS